MLFVETHTQNCDYHKLQDDYLFDRGRVCNRKSAVGTGSVLFLNLTGGYADVYHASLIYTNNTLITFLYIRYIRKLKS